VRTITGVATSITAFIGRALRGDLDEPTITNNFGDYERLFGGLSADSMMSYAVRDFYSLGGSQAIIVRIDNRITGAPTDAPSTAATIELPGATPAEDLKLEAASVGSWGKHLKALVDWETRKPDDTSLFNLEVYEQDDEGILGASEQFINVSSKSDDPRYLPRVLEESSMLVRVKGAMSSGRPKRTRAPKSPVTSPPSWVDAPISATGGTDGGPLRSTDYLGSEDDKTGIYALKKADLFNLLCIPPAVRGGNTDPAVYSEAMKFCAKERAMLIVDSPAAWGRSPTPTSAAIKGLRDDLKLTGTEARNAALYFPRVRKSDPKRDGQEATFVPCGIVAGLMAKTDTERGVWKAPAGLDAAISGIRGLQANLTDDENGQLNPLGINCLRTFPVNGTVVWGARTLRGADRIGDEYKYVPVRRMALYIEESLYRGTQWVVFEPNDEPLWAQIRLNVSVFMHDLFRQGAFQGKTPKEAYLVKCDKETTTQSDINKGIVNILVGFAPLKPAEFVIIKIQQLAGQLEV
jgi:phage tail sheath protein FI